MFIDQGLLVRETERDGEICWRLGHANETLVSERTTVAEPPDDTLLNMHYVLPLPRIPDTVQGVLAARVDLLHPLEKLILQHAAIIGRTFWLSSLVELADNLSEQTVLRALESLIQRDFLIEDDDAQVRSPIENDRVFSFKHILIRDVVYNNIPRTRRSQEHAQLAFWLEEHTRNNLAAFIELLAYHYQQALITWSATMTTVNVNSIQEASDGEEVSSVQLTRSELRKRAIKYLTFAGDQALNSYYTLRAIQAYNDALELLLDEQSNAPTLVAMYEKLGDAYSQRGTMDEAWQAYRRGLRLATGEGVAPESVDLLYLYERLSELGTRWYGLFDTPPNPQEARTYINAGLQLLEGKGLSTDRAAFLTYQAFWYIGEIETATYAQKAELMEQALASGHEALRLAEQLNNASILSLTLDALGFIYTQYHKYEEAHQIGQRRQQLEEKLTDREELYDLYNSLGKIHVEIAEYATALTWFGRSWNNAQTMESPFLLLISMTWRMWTWLQWDRWQEAREVALDMLRLIEQYQQDEKRQLWALETLAMLAYRQGNQEQGEYYARQYKRLTDQQAERNSDETTAEVSTSMRDISLAREDWTRATTEYTEKLKQSEPLPSPEVLTTLAELLVTTRAPNDVQEEMCNRAITVADESGACKSLALAFRARGRMYTEQQKWPLAKDDLYQALRRCEALDIPWERGLTLYAIGMLYKNRAEIFDREATGTRNSDMERARYHFEQALGFFESLSAEPDIARVKEAMGQGASVGA
jgi:predicted ATPase